MYIDPREAFVITKCYKLPEKRNKQFCLKSIVYSIFIIFIPCKHLYYVCNNRQKPHVSKSIVHGNVVIPRAFQQYSSLIPSCSISLPASTVCSNFIWYETLLSTQKQLHFLVNIVAYIKLCLLLHFGNICN